MGTVKQGHSLLKPNQRSALEYIHLKPWRKSFVSKEFLTTPVALVDSDPTSSEFIAGPSIINQLERGSRSVHVGFPNGKVMAQEGGIEDDDEG
jgi:hypothetical protein